MDPVDINQGFTGSPPSIGTDESNNGWKSSHDSPPPEPFEFFLDNTHTNCSIETYVDTSTNNYLNLSCFSCNLQYYPIMEIYLPKRKTLTTAKNLTINKPHSLPNLHRGHHW